MDRTIRLLVFWGSGQETLESAADYGKGNGCIT